MPELSVSLSYSIITLLMSAIAAGALSFFSYHTTIPAIARRRRILLMTLRTLGLFVLLVLIGEPLLSLVVRRTDVPETVVLIDNSRSMTIKDRIGDRSVLTRSILNAPWIRQLGFIRFALFDSRVRFLPSFSPDSVSFTGQATDIAGALNKIQELADGENIQSIVMISDGNSTNGSSPLFAIQRLHIPVFTVGIGDTSEQRDLAVRNVLTNTVVYAGTRVPATVTVKSSGYSGQRVEVTLTNGSAVLDRQFLSLQEGSREYPVILEYTPDSEGVQKYTVVVSSLSDEVTDQNNRFSFFTKVLKSKMNVLLIAGAPGPDVAFLKRSLERDSAITVSAYVEQNDGTFHDQPLSSGVLETSDCIVLVGFPGPASLTGTISAVAMAAASGKSILFLESRTIDFTKLKALEQSLPFAVETVSGNEVQAFVHIPEQQWMNPIFQGSGMKDHWGSLPPLFKIQNVLRPKPESALLAVARIQNITTNNPLMLSSSVNHRRSIAILGYGLWRWKMLSDKGSELLDRFLANGVRWLTTRDDDRKVRIAPEKEFFTSQEPAGFNGQVYDESLQPVDDAVVTLSVTGGNESYEVVMSPVGHGQYEGHFEGLREGDYHYKGTARSGSAVLGLDRGTFSIGGLNSEFQNTRTNAMLLRQLALRTGGLYVEPDQINGLPAAIRSLPNYQPRDVIQTGEFELWNLQLSLAVIVLLFSVEWFLRKRYGML